MSCSIEQAIASAINQLQQLNNVQDIDADFEARLLLAWCMQVDRSYLHAWPDKPLSEHLWQQYEAYIKRRAGGEPIAYIMGEKEFWSRTFKVTPATLIPRADTETLIEVVLNTLSEHEQLLLADLGTGSGAIAISLGLERPNWRIHACDKHQLALDVAQANGQTLNATNVHYYLGSWCTALPENNYHAIIANPPYIAPGDPHLNQGDLPFEPAYALVADKQGLAAYIEIIEQSKAYLRPGGYVLFEHGYDQASMLKGLLQQANYQQINSYKDYSGQNRVIVAQKPIN